MREAPTIGSSLKGGYQLVRFLGAGGMGAVYEALAPDGRRVAIKVLLEIPGGEADRELLVARFKREANVIGSFESRHIVPLLDAGVDDALGIPFIVMPLMAGLDLEQLVEKIGPIHPTVAVRIIRQACRALVTAHAAGVVHRDIKPANMYLDHDAKGRVTVRVLDFGIAKWSEEGKSLTQTGSIMGTPTYMAPEQTLDAKNVDARADVWSLAMTLYAALCGQPPFGDDLAIAQIFIALNTKDVRHVQDLGPWLDPGLATVVHGGLIRALERRCPSAAAFVAALEPFAYGSDEIDCGMFEPLPPKLRQAAQPRATLGGSWICAEPRGPEPSLAVTVVDGALGQKLGDQYELLWRIGQGGMGAVYEAVADDGNRYAVKVINADLAGKNAGARRRFVREARAATSLHSDNVVRVVHADTDPRQQSPYIVMEMLRGVDLERRIRRAGPLSPVAAARVFAQACRGVQAAHDLGLVHRDIKPANLFLHETPSGEVVVKVCDFGIAKQTNLEGELDTTGLTRTGGVIGSPMYMSPEQAKNAKEVDHRTDVWSLGIALFEALTGAPPWEGKTTVGEIMLAIYTEPLPHIQDKAPWVPPGLVQVVSKMLHRNLGERAQSMREVAAALAPFTEGSLELTAKQLEPLDMAARAAHAKRAAGPELTSMGAASVATTIHTEPRRRGRRWLVPAVAVCALGGAGVYFTTRTGAQGDAPSGGLSAAPSPLPAAAATAAQAGTPSTTRTTAPASANPETTGAGAGTGTEVSTAAPASSSKRGPNLARSPKPGASATATAAPLPAPLPAPPRAPAPPKAPPPAGLGTRTDF